MPLKIIYEDRDIVVVNKDPGVIVHSAAAQAIGTLVNLFEPLCGSSGIGGVMRPGIVHRLDKDTSGVIVVAKNDLSHRPLGAVQNRETSKDYLAIVRGKTPPTGKVAFSISRHPVNRLKMRVSEDGKESLTYFKTLATFGGEASLVMTSPRTGEPTR